MIFRMLAIVTKHVCTLLKRRSAFYYPHFSVKCSRVTQIGGPLVTWCRAFTETAQ